tara:strand:- start:64 stop:474 length:411 start_codon:yes stop_codon:yes gene_type:complete
LDHLFTLIILCTALIAFFIEELSNAVKKYWNNQLLRHAGLMMFIGFLGFGYYPTMNGLFIGGLRYITKVAMVLAGFIPFLESKLFISYVIIHCFLSVGFASCIALIYYVKTYKFYPYSIQVLWVAWLIIAAMYFTS